MAPQPKRRTCRQLAAIRLSELYRLADFRRHHGVALDPGAFRFVLAATLAVGGPDGIRHAGGGRLAAWSGLDVTTLDSAGRQCGLPPLNHDALGDIVDKAIRWRDEHGRRPIGSEKVAALLGVTAEERWACRLGTIGSVDETKAERRVRRAGEKVRQRSALRRAAGHKPRAEYEAAAKGHGRPWEAAGVSRATWYRRHVAPPVETV